ncbi:MAG: polyphosphate:AMP phosphotransferase [Rhodocyclaceae bacterium]|jgi:polyphosphate:AMP phosphotransferase|nr:polyphosphate:AMP phosphotransferase [Rhodocyclaceae bacterium]MBX3677145.1 polyphosphate:AMP phosphotransferase [Rhodocyclaceae bacterium]MCB1893268.1 polyphosphate:AMP phosphotransferase [Rhodocyclaceae bacterium]MCP5297755.1 polyphosphate:AMP phosphotransferase [Zoogloeaceae bacterium]PKO67978.1 MAG: polyphosphate:AMP phosphotransferase [Betaproteobacteria bacterium HGW-Betaproteobacteria-14]
MFESAELGHKIDKATFDKQAPRLRADLLDAQYDMGALKKYAVIILVNGVNGAGKGETVNLLNAWMDPRHIQTHAFPPPTDEERERPFMWRFWRALPPKGKIGILFGNWYTDPIVNRARKITKAADLDQSIEEINRFEKMLADEGTLILKVWMHLSKAAQKKRLTALEKNKKTRWRVTKADWEHFAMYDKFRKVSERVLRHTSTGFAPWIVVEGADENYRSLTVAGILLDALRKRQKIEQTRGWKARSAAAPLPQALDSRDLINSLDMSLALSKKRFEKDLEKYQGRLNLLTRDPKFRERSLIVVFEGSDAAGKGGSIRRITGALDARQYQIIPVAAPTEEERAQPYLWRFWRQVPRIGRITIFDRSWYGRVLVERVEGFCQEADWMRAYAEINDFEDQLVRSGAIVVKFWLTITAEEQLKRFKEREKTRFKRFKITEEDWRNRKKWDEYEHAVCDMIDRSSTEIAPWTLVEANDKYHARIKVLKTLCDRLEDALK